MTDTQVQVEIRGRVQGVGFRDWLVQVARMIGVAGWVRNRHDGWVEAVISAGSREQLDAVLALIHRGPDGSRVEDVATRPADPAELEFARAGDFRILPDA